MANNAIIYNAALNGAMGGGQLGRWLTSNQSSSYLRARAAAVAIATEVDSKIPTNPLIGAAQGQLMQSLCQGVLAERDLSKTDPNDYSDIANAIVAAYLETAPDLLPEGGGGGSVDPLSNTFYVDGGTGVTPADQDGSIAAPFATLAQAFAVADAFPGIELVFLVTPGEYFEGTLSTTYTESLAIVSLGDTVFTDDIDAPNARLTLFSIGANSVTAGSATLNRSQAASVDCDGVVNGYESAFGNGAPGSHIASTNLLLADCILDLPDGIDIDNSPSDSIWANITGTRVSNAPITVTFAVAWPQTPLLIVDAYSYYEPGTTNPNFTVVDGEIFAPGIDNSVPLSNTLYVDGGTSVPLAVRNGSINAPFGTIAAALAAAETLAVPVAIIVTQGDYTSEGTLTSTFASALSIVGIAQPVIVGDIDLPDAINVSLEWISFANLQAPSAVQVSLEQCFGESVDTTGALIAVNCNFNGTSLDAAALSLDLCEIAALSAGINIDNATAPETARITRTSVATGSAPIAVAFVGTAGANILQLDDVSTFLPGTTTDQFSISGGLIDGESPIGQVTSYTDGQVLTTEADLPRGKFFESLVVGAGASGASAGSLTAANGPGGGGGGTGGRSIRTLTRSQLIAMLPITVIVAASTPGVAGGTGTANGTAGISGAHSQFGSITAYGGGAASTGASVSGGGGGLLTRSTGRPAGQPATPANTSNPVAGLGFGGATSSSTGGTAGAPADYGGAGGGVSATVGTGGAGGRSVSGPGGGGAGGGYNNTGPVPAAGGEGGHSGENNGANVASGGGGTAGAAGVAGISPGGNGGNGSDSTDPWLRSGDGGGGGGSGAVGAISAQGGRGGNGGFPGGGGGGGGFSPDATVPGGASGDGGAGYVGLRCIG